jgi:hypothetical protein
VKTGLLAQEFGPAGLRAIEQTWPDPRELQPLASELAWELHLARFSLAEILCVLYWLQPYWAQLSGAIQEKTPANLCWDANWIACTLPGIPQLHRTDWHTAPSVDASARGPAVFAALISLNQLGCRVAASDC